VNDITVVSELVTSRRPLHPLTQGWVNEHTALLLFRVGLMNWWVGYTWFFMHFKSSRI